MIEVVGVMGFIVLLLLFVALNLHSRLRDIETKLDNTHCVLLHPERESAWCPEAARNGLEVVE